MRKVYPLSYIPIIYRHISHPCHPIIAAGYPVVVERWYDTFWYLFVLFGAKI